MPTSPLVSVVAPVLDEELVVEEFYERTTAAMEAIAPPVGHEIVFVDDGSTDRTPEVLAKLAARDPRVRVLALSRNFGHQLALTAGLDHAAGDAVVAIDADLQDPPEVIARLVERWREGYKVVYGVRTRREGERRFKLLTAKAFYRVLHRLSDTPLPVDSGDFRLLDRQVVDVLGTVREENRYLRGLVSWVGFRQVGVPYERDRRYAGRTGYTLTRMLRFAVDGVTSFTERPLRLALQLGSLVTVGAAVGALTILVGRLVDPSRSLPGYASLMVVVLFLGGVQLFTIGLLGEYVGRIYRESKDRPLYVVADRVNLPEGPRSEPPRRPGPREAPGKSR